MKRINKACIFLICLAVLFGPTVNQAFGYSQSEEESLGKQYAKEVEGSLQLSDDKALNERVQKVGQILAKIANEDEVPATYGSSEIFKFKYQFKVVKDPDINAFSLPGGIIYVNTGLLEAIGTDDELAGVLAHEIAHSAHHHMSQLVRKQSKVDRYVALVAIAGILSNMKSTDLNNLLMGAQMLKTGKLSSSTQIAEKDADRTAVAYLVKSQYNPEGILSFMKKLDEQRDKNPDLPLGIYQTHPAPFRRVVSITKAMREEGFKIDERKARDIAYAKPVPIKEGSDQYQVVISRKVLYAPATLSGGTCSKERAQQIATTVNNLLDSGVTPRDIQEDVLADSLIVKGRAILTIQKEDGVKDSNDNRALLDKARSTLAYALWADWLCTNCEAMEDNAEDLVQ